MPQIPAGARITTRLRARAGHRVRDAGSTVIQAARDLHLSWPTVMDAFRTAAREVTEDGTSCAACCHDDGG
nr:transposase family protein [Streptomyces oceani]